MTDKIAVMICGHASRETGAVDAFDVLASHLKSRLPEIDVACGFLGGVEPELQGGLDELTARGVSRVVCMPGMLSATGSTNTELTRALVAYGDAHNGLDLAVARELAIDSKLLAAASDRIAKAEAEAGDHVAREDSLLMVVGSGADDMKANSNVSKVARMLWEGMGFGWAEVSYARFAHPRVDEGLRKSVRLGYKRIIVFPYALFSDESVEQAYTWADSCAAANPDVEVIKADYLSDHACLLECFIERIGEAIGGTRNMNCQRCDYREQIIATDGHHHDHHHDHHHHDHHDTDRDGETGGS